MNEKEIKELMYDALLATFEESEYLKTGVKSQNRNIEAILQRELQRLQKEVGVGSDLKVVWQPYEQHELSGEVKGNVIYIYDVELESAIRTLRHEFLDYILTSKLIHPILGLFNLLLKVKEKEIYEEKERLVDKLTEFL